MRIGIIGICSKHLAFFRQALSVSFPDGQHVMTHACGYDAPELIPTLRGLTLCDTPQALIHAVDAVVIALRDGTQHAALARMAMEQNKPVFVDKPFACSTEDAIAMLRCAEQTGAACTGGSTICYTKTVRQLKSQLPHCQEYSIQYQADPFSPFGGWYFYGSHLTDLCVTLFGSQWLSVTARLRGDAVTAIVRYSGFQVRLCSTPQVQPPIVTADKPYVLDDIHCYEAGMEHFCGVAEGRYSGNAELLAASVRLLNGILTSIRKEGRPYPE